MSGGGPAGAGRFPPPKYRSEAVKLPSSEITSEGLYLSRRQFLLALAGVAAGLGAVSHAHQRRKLLPSPYADELGNAATPLKRIQRYNNYYEFGVDKEQVYKRVSKLALRPWTVEVGGLCHRPRTFDLDEILRMETEERVYRHRCVEGWSMVIPWEGFPLRRLLERVEPMGSAAYVRFESLKRPRQMPGQRGILGKLAWPYVEGLRLDEAMHELTLLCTGLYGKPLLAQNGAPLRLAVPWKYGFKSPKAIVRIDLVEQPPSTFWVHTSPKNYGFFANVNPGVSTPRWDQQSERRIGEFKRRPTVLFNGYADEVAGLYAGMDLARCF